MVVELDGQIEAVKAKIAKVEAEIEKVIERIDSRLDGPEMLAILVEREKGLRTREADLRGEKQLLLMAKLQAPGGVPLLCVFIVYALSCSILPHAISLKEEICTHRLITRGLFAGDPDSNVTDMFRGLAIKIDSLADAVRAGDGSSVPASSINETLLTDLRKSMNVVFVWHDATTLEDLSKAQPCSFTWCEARMVSFFICF